MVVNFVRVPFVSPSLDLSIYGKNNHSSAPKTNQGFKLLGHFDPQNMTFRDFATGEYRFGPDVAVEAFRDEAIGEEEFQRHIRFWGMGPTSQAEAKKLQIYADVLDHGMQEEFQAEERRQLGYVKQIADERMEALPYFDWNDLQQERLRVNISSAAAVGMPMGLGLRIHSIKWFDETNVTIKNEAGEEFQVREQDISAVFGPVGLPSAGWHFTVRNSLEGGELLFRDLGQDYSDQRFLSYAANFTGLQRLGFEVDEEMHRMMYPGERQLNEGARALLGEGLPTFVYDKTSLSEDVKIALSVVDAVGPHYDERHRNDLRLWMRILSHLLLPKTFRSYISQYGELILQLERTLSRKYDKTHFFIDAIQYEFETLVQDIALIFFHATVGGLDKEMRRPLKRDFLSWEERQWNEDVLVARGLFALSAPTKGSVLRQYLGKMYDPKNRNVLRKQISNRFSGDVDLMVILDQLDALPDSFEPFIETFQQEAWERYLLLRYGALEGQPSLDDMEYEVFYGE